MTSEERVLTELKEKISELFIKIEELRVSQVERNAFNKEKEEYQFLITDYKKHKEAFEKRVKEWNSQPQ